MKKLMKTFSKTVIAFGMIYFGCLSQTVFSQENFIFYPTKLAQDFQFRFNQKFEEIYFKTKDHKNLHGLLFKADATKGLIFYLHGNGGNVNSWGDVAHVYTELNYDVFIMDYRGCGKSEGEIASEIQFFDDVKCGYRKMNSRYEENEIIILGCSVGTGAAAWLASNESPKKLILQSPYYSLTDLMSQLMPSMSAVLLEYKFETFKYLQNTKVPVVLFHGKEDKIISYESSLKLKAFLKQGDQCFILDNQGHNND